MLPNQAPEQRNAANGKRSGWIGWLKFFDTTKLYDRPVKHEIQAVRMIVSAEWCAIFAAFHEIEEDLKCKCDFSVS